MNTKLLYMEDMGQLESNAAVEKVEHKDDKVIVYLDQTVFYPQGGGQPYDTGEIEGKNSKFIVEEVRFVDGEVLHIGHFEGREFSSGEAVTCKVDSDRRQLHRRLHSGGHVIDMAISQLGYDWIPTKGYHFPEGPYIEYQGELDPAKNQELAQAIEAKTKEILSQDTETQIKFVTLEELAKLVRHVPEYLPKNKPLRVVMYGDFAVPCGGTHVKNLKDIGSLTVRKIKVKDGNIRVAYEIQ